MIGGLGWCKTPHSQPQKWTTSWIGNATPPNPNSQSSHTPPIANIPHPTARTTMYAQLLPPAPVYTVGNLLGAGHDSCTTTTLDGAYRAMEGVWGALGRAGPRSIVVTATCAARKEQKASYSATLSPKREVVCVRLSPDKAEKKRNIGTPSPSFAKMTFDLTAEKEYATFPLIQQLSEKQPLILYMSSMRRRSILYEREMFRSRDWAAPPTPAKAPVCQDLAFHVLLPAVRLKLNPKKKVEKEVRVKKEMQCYRWEYAMNKNACVTQWYPTTCHV